MGGRITPDVVLADTVPLEERFARTPRHYTIRGVFFEPFVRTLGEEWRAVEKELLEPPEDGEYSALGEYPQIDHARLAVAAARKQFPGLSLREGLRRIERGAAAHFAQSTLGKVLTTVVSDPSSAFRTLPTAYAHIQRGGILRVTPRSSGARVEARDFAPWLDCSTIGAFEGMVVLFGKRPSMTVEMLSESDANFEIEWS
ncbi:MAG: DUF2378 family protein [Polyangiales bacterium]